MKQANEIQELRAEIKQLRTLLAVTYSGYKLYADEGNLQDHSAQPFIDFRNDTVMEIDKKMMKRAVKKAPKYKSNALRSLIRTARVCLGVA